MQNVDEDTIAHVMPARHVGAADPRLKQNMTSVLRHPHAFARDAELTKEEWFKGILFLTEVGQHHR